MNERLEDANMDGARFEDAARERRTAAAVRARLSQEGCMSGRESDASAMERQQLWRYVMDNHFAVFYTAIERRRRALAAEASFGAGRGGSMIQPGIDEALACQDMLQPAPVQPSPIVRLCARLVAAFVRHDPLSERWLCPATPSVRGGHVTPWWPFTTGRIWR